MEPLNKISLHRPGTHEQVLDEICSQYPRVGKALKIFWGSKDFTEYTESLFYNENNKRQGFKQDTIANIIKLQALHDHRYPQFKAPEPSGWMGIIVK